MLMSSLVCLCMIVAPNSHVVDNPVEQKVYQIDVCLYQTESLNGNVKGVTSVLTSPVLSALSGRPARFIVGGEEPVPLTKPVEFEPSGFIITIIPKMHDEKSCTIQLSAEDRSVQVKKDDLLIQSGIHVKRRGRIELNKKMSIRLAGEAEGKQTWLDFTVSEVDSQGQPLTRRFSVVEK
ncbi:MAG: hypothetical protein QM703_21085 [Gemmatales bacterium]